VATLSTAIETAAACGRETLDLERYSDGSLRGKRQEGDDCTGKVKMGASCSAGIYILSPASTNSKIYGGDVQRLGRMKRFHFSTIPTVIVPAVNAIALSYPHALGTCHVFTRMRLGNCG
jgi:hypothetical protein